MSPKKGVRASARRAPGAKSGGFTDEERAAMKERARELKADKADGESALLAKIAEMKGRIAPSRRGSTPSSWRPRRPSRRKRGTGCPPMPGTARSSASSRARRSSSRATPRSASATGRTWTKAPCGDRVRAEGADRRRRGADRRARQEGGRLRMSVLGDTSPDRPGRSASWSGRTHACARFGDSSRTRLSHRGAADSGVALLRARVSHA